LKILITGGAGFIGSNLVDHFLEIGHEVVVLDNLSTGYKKNIDQHKNNESFTFIKGDIRNYEVCKAAMQNCDLVSHQAALGSVPRSISDPLNTNSVNISGFLNVLTAARDAHIKRFVYAASSSTYGDSKQLPKIESEIGTPLSPYAVTKYVNELYADVYSKNFGIQCIGLRYFNVFGPRQNPEGAYAAVIPLWITQIMNEERPIINGDGLFSRDFTYVSNVVHANMTAMFSSTDDILQGQHEYYNRELDMHKYPQTEGTRATEIPIQGTNFAEVFNVASGGNTTLFELHKNLKENLLALDASIKNLKPIIGDFRVGDIPHSQASIIKAITILNYQPKVNAELGLKKTVEWYFKKSVQ
jgi:UDP-N-acetylglucosamine/UDP-N-acetylgalactosamine 4-epimerase